MSKQKQTRRERSEWFAPFAAHEHGGQWSGEFCRVQGLYAKYFSLRLGGPAG